MKSIKPIISNQIAIEEITDACQKDFRSYILNFFELEFAWFYNCYSTFKDFDKYIVLVYLINKTLSTYNKHLYKLTFDEFYNSKTIEIEKISIIDIVRDLNLSKETARRKLNEMTAQNILIREKKKIIINQDAFEYQKPKITIKNLSKALAHIAKHLKSLRRDLSQSYIENEIKKNFTHYWNTFLNFQINYLLRSKRVYQNYENLYVAGVCALNATYNYRNLTSNEKTSDNKKNVSLSFENFVPELINLTLEQSKGLNPTTISELTRVPRASVIRKLGDLQKMGLIQKNENNLYSFPTDPQKLKFTKLSENNHENFREMAKDLINFML